MELLETLQALNACHGPAGDEGQVADAIEKLARPYADEIFRDVLGNLIVRRRGNGPKVLFAAHMDSVGVIVTHIEEKGFLRFGKLGGLSAHSCLSACVRFKNGVRGVIASEERVKAKDLTLDDLYIDIGADSRAAAEGLVRLGDTAVFDARAFEQGGRIISPYLDDRICCAALLMTLAQIEKSPNDLYFAFTVQEELGDRGAKCAAYGIDPDYAIVMDVTATDDVPGSERRGTCRLGGGAGIKVMDRSVICQRQMVERLTALAQEHAIKTQTDILTIGGSDAGPIHNTREGVYTGGISVPSRYTHSPREMAAMADVEACVALAAAFAGAGLEDRA